MKIIVGLGNPGKEYEGTYHNIGFRFIDTLAKKLGVEVNKKQCKSLIGEIKIQTQNGLEKIVLVKPLTYMNLSGEAVVSIKNKYKVDTADIYIISDDIDLPVGKVRYREKGSAGTHNGLRNIIQLLGDENFKRIRVGINTNSNIDLADYVLSKISFETLKNIDLSIEEGIKLFLKNN